MRGFHVKVLDDFSSGKATYLDNVEVEIIDGSILDVPKLRQCLDGVEAVVHLAAAGNVIESIEKPHKNFEINVRGTICVLEAMKACCVPKIIFSSTGGALFGHTTPPVREDTLPMPISPYGASKLSCEAYIRAFSSCFEMQHTIFRFGNVIGPNCIHKNGFLNKFVRNIIEGDDLLLFGEPTRDLIRVEDIALMIFRALTGVNAAENQTFHLASGIETKISDVASFVLDKFENASSSIINKGHRDGEVVKNFADIGKAKRLLGFEPDTDIMSAVSNTCDWLYDQHLDGIAKR